MRVCSNAGRLSLFLSIFCSCLQYLSLEINNFTALSQSLPRTRGQSCAYTCLFILAVGGKIDQRYSRDIQYMQPTVQVFRRTKSKEIFDKSICGSAQ